MRVLQRGSEHWVAVKSVGFCEGREVLEHGDPTECFRRAAAHSPAWEHLWEVSVRWSRQNVPLHDSQRKGRKSS